MPPRLHAVYILASHSRCLYIGITNDLVRRISQHRTNGCRGFSAKYRTTSLVFYETTSDVSNAIAREKQLKGWRREKKIALIERDNPAWHDLAAGWFDGSEARPEAPEWNEGDERPG